MKVIASGTPTAQDISSMFAVMRHYVMKMLEGFLIGRQEQMTANHGEYHYFQRTQNCVETFELLTFAIYLIFVHNLSANDSS